MDKNSYWGQFFYGIGSLAVGMGTTFKEFFTPKITQQYPENRKELVLADRFRGCLEMPHDAENRHRCVACGLCQMACPNGTIRVTPQWTEAPDGKKKKILDSYQYDLGRCMFCQLCVRACPHGAIRFNQEFENAVFDRSKLNFTLNRPGSRVIEK